MEIFDANIEKLRNILNTKGADYNNGDVLSNFKLAGAVINQKAEMNCLSLISTKLARLGNLLNGNKEPKNESVEDTILDMINYLLILDAIRKEK